MYIFGNAGPWVCPGRNVYSDGPTDREEGGAAVMGVQMVDIPQDVRADFCLLCTDDSLMLEGIAPGDIFVYSCGRGSQWGTCSGFARWGNPRWKCVAHRRTLVHHSSFTALQSKNICRRRFYEGACCWCRCGLDTLAGGEPSNRRKRRWKKGGKQAVNKSAMLSGSSVNVQTIEREGITLKFEKVYWFQSKAHRKTN